MRFIPTKTHGILDYVVASLLIASPWLFAFAHGGPETWVPVILGALTIGYSLLTDYDLGVLRSLSMSAHLALDSWSAIFLAASPWIFRFSEFVYWPHLLFGIVEMAVALFTVRKISAPASFK